jgi:hypothetical protein
MYAAPGGWTVAVEHFADVPLPSTTRRYYTDDATSPGWWLHVKRHGTHVAYVAQPADLARFFPLAALQEM